ncbi:MAG: CDP-archaeol synthase, partial [Nanoarchaeota archaeon]
MANILFDIASNPVFSATFFAWFFAQLIKMVLKSLKGKPISLTNFFKDGGMPSSHSALVTSLAASILLLEGPTTAFFISLVIALIVIRDAVGVRFAVGTHAKALNKMLLNKDRIVEHEGHTVPQAFAGIVLGITTAVVAVNFGYSALLVIQVFYLMLPGIAANAAPILAKKIQPSFDAPIDGNAKLKNKPILGKNKTWRGAIAGIAAVLIVVILQKLFYPFFSSISLFDYSIENALIVGLVVGIGVIAGDLVKSFV